MSNERQLTYIVPRYQDKENGVKTEVKFDINSQYMLGTPVLDLKDCLRAMCAILTPTKLMEFLHLCESRNIYMPTEWEISCDTYEQIEYTYIIKNDILELLNEIGEGDNNFACWLRSVLVE